MRRRPWATTSSSERTSSAFCANRWRSVLSLIIFDFERAQIGRGSAHKERPDRRYESRDGRGAAWLIGTRTAHEKLSLWWRDLGNLDEAEVCHPARRSWLAAQPAFCAAGARSLVEWSALTVPTNTRFAVAKSNSARVDSASTSKGCCSAVRVRFGDENWKMHGEEV